MKETPQAYIQRILANLKGRDPLKVQASTAKKLERLVHGQATSRLRKRPGPGKWSVAEILAHLADVEIATGWRIRQVLASHGTPLQAFDQDAWAASGYYSRRDPYSSIEQFRVLREGNLALLKSLMPAQWKRYGVHAERGKQTILQFVRLAAGHDLNHIAQIEKILAPGKS
jgi:hypothetical protein